MIEKGLISFITQKLENSVSEASIKHTLMRAGFPESHIDAAIIQVKRADKAGHQKAVAENDFLPPLRKNKNRVSVSEEPEEPKLKTYSDRPQKGLFKGRLLRRDFIMGFLFFFGLGYVSLVLAGYFLATLFPELWSKIMEVAMGDNAGLFPLIIPAVLLPVTVMIFSLITRRLHNLGMPGGLGLIFFAVLLLPAEDFSFYGTWLMYAVIAVIFIMLITAKGSRVPNEFGPYPSDRGSFFKRIFNV